MRDANETKNKRQDSKAGNLDTNSPQHNYENDGLTKIWSRRIYSYILPPTPSQESTMPSHNSPASTLEKEKGSGKIVSPFFPSEGRGEKGIIKETLVNSISEAISRHLKEDSARARNSSDSTDDDSTQPRIETIASTALADYLTENINRQSYVTDDENKNLYSRTLDLIKHQRTSYLSYDPTFPSSSSPPPALPQLAKLTAQIIPSPNVVASLKPIVLWLPSEHGPLQKPTARIVAESIPLTQNLLDNAMKNNLIWFLKDESWRLRVKESTSGYIVERSVPGKSEEG